MTIDDVLITAELDRRPVRAPDHAAESRALVALVAVMAESPGRVFQKLADTALELCRAGSAGISVWEPGGAENVFRWRATAGEYAPYLGGTMPRHFSPCGTVLDRGRTLLMADPERFFPYIAQLCSPVREVLLVPFHQNGAAVGTVWVVAHAPGAHFDAEDVRLITSLTTFAGAAVQALGRIEAAEAAEAESRKQTERMRLLWEAAAVLLTTDEPDAMMRGLFAKIARHFGFDTYFNFMVDESGAYLRLESCVGIAPAAADSIRRLEFGQAVCGAVAVSRAPITATCIQDSDDPRVQLVKGFGIRAYACNPLLAGDRLLGTLSFASCTRDTFDPDELEFLRTICRYVTVAYERLGLVRELRDSDRKKDDFLALLAHELRNPLAPIRNGLQVLRLSDDHAVRERSQVIMDRQLAHMVRMIDDLLDVSRISRNKMELRRSRVTLSEVISNAVETAGPLVQAAGHELTVTLPGVLVHLDADLTRLAQVFGNLLSNSAKYTPRGGRIWLTAETAEDHVRVVIRDTGIGIPAAALVGIFDMFSQVDRSVERATGGLGIGLALVRGLVEMHGGTVTAESAGEGQGSTFTVALPTALAQERATTELLSNGSAAQQPFRILVADDNQDGAESMAEMLMLMGHEVRTAHDGVEAVEAAEEFRPDVVLMDVGMPRLNGLDATRRIRERPWGRGATIIALTGWGQEGDRERSRAAGCDGHLVKPVNLADLGRALAAVHLGGRD